METFLIVCAALALVSLGAVFGATAVAMCVLAKLGEDDLPQGLPEIDREALR